MAGRYQKNNRTGKERASQARAKAANRNRNRKPERTGRTVIIIAICVAVLAIGIGFFAVSRYLSRQVPEPQVLGNVSVSGANLNGLTKEGAVGSAEPSVFLSNNVTALL